MEDTKESTLNDYPKVISYECSKKIIEQMEKNICKITIDKNQGTGFFCEIPFENKEKLLPVFITNNHIINKDFLNKKDAKIKLDIKSEEDMKELNLSNRMKYTNEEYDITIIEIKPEDKINNYLELDDIIMNDILNNKNNIKEYISETIYIIQYPENKLSVSYGILDNIYEDEKYNFNHKCSTRGGASGSPILNINNKVIGIHKEGNNKKQYNKGTFLNFPIKEFIKLNNKKDEIVKKAYYNKNVYSMIPDIEIMNRMNMINQMNMMNTMYKLNNMLYEEQKSLIRLKKEFYLCQKDVDLMQIGCTFNLDNNNYYFWRVSMYGPNKTPYEGGIFTIKIYFPEDYPNHGPEFRFLNLIYHLNVNYADKNRLGHISLNSLYEWQKTGKVVEKPVYGVKQALFDIFCLFYNQNPCGAYNTEMASMYLNNRDIFNKNAKEWTRKYAMS